MDDARIELSSPRQVAGRACFSILLGGVRVIHLSEDATILMSTLPYPYSSFKQGWEIKRDLAVRFARVHDNLL